MRWFQVAGADKNFGDATATIEGDIVVVQNENVTQPVSVRHAWVNYPEDGNLHNGEELPTSPFRTDD